VSVTCPRCHRVLEFSGPPPSFCGYCGTRLGQAPTVDHAADAVTMPPRDERGDTAEAPTLVPRCRPVEEEQVAGYRIIRELGSGGMGKVYEAEEVATGRHVALKLIAPEYAQSAPTVERFRREGRLASSLSHPRCVFVLAADEDAGRPYIVMELMPGNTLESLVKEQGPLPPEQAVVKILDVIDGLREAHRLGMVHRDIKPSNCFLEADGRVKVGDFGLAKSLVSQTNLTRTGQFLGTVLYSSPEQVRGDPADQQTDLYAVAATLYFLLTGRAPFQTGDAASTLARIVADPAPHLRTVRKEIPAALDQVVLRGLERDRQKRWRNLDEFREALLPFAPGQLTFVGVGLRFAAYLLDSLVLAPLTFLFAFLVMFDLTTHRNWHGYAAEGLKWALVLGYYAVQEGLWGRTLGKRWLRLRVWTADGSDPPGLLRGLLRTGFWMVVIGLPSVVVGMMFSSADLMRDQSLSLLVFATNTVFLSVGVLVMVSTMRARNGYRCLHDVLSGTRVVRLPEPEQRLSLPGRDLERALLPAADAPCQLGGFVVRGVLAQSAAGQVLLAEDAALGRKTILWLRPGSEPPLDAARRGLSRPTRPRWLAGGRLPDAQWDAFLAPTGSPLAELVAARGPLPWPKARPILEQLTDELAAARADDTLPRTLGVDQVWVQENGQVQLLAVPLGEAPPTAADGSSEGADPGPALALLGATATLLLEGRQRGGDDPPGPVRAPLPGQAARILDRLVPKAPRPYADVEQVAADLAATRDKPEEVTRGRRAAHLAVQAGFLGIGLLFMLVGGCMATVIPAVGPAVNAAELQADRADLIDQAWTAAAISSLGPGATPDVAALVQLDSDLRLANRLTPVAEDLGREYRARLQAMSWPSRTYARAVEQQLESLRQAERKKQNVPLHLGISRATAASRATMQRNGAGEHRLRTVMAGFLVAWPLLWVLWAFVVRGGVSFRLLGFSLVRADGRPAARWQCAVRAFLVWAPVVVLLVFPIWLDGWYWSGWDGSGRHGWEPWLSLVSWWGGWGLLGLHLVLALRSPARGLHDRLAGTYLVPR
jgi:hypothetical protein